MTSQSEQRRSPLPYVVPMVAFLLLTALEGFVRTVDGRPYAVWYPTAYAVKLALVTALCWAGRSAWRDLLPWPGKAVLALAFFLGVLIAVLWVSLDRYYPKFAVLGTRSEFDPTVLSGPAQVAFLAVRLTGLVLVVPLFEELFWRSFLVRWLIDPEFWRVPIGRVTPVAGVVTSLLFAVAHPEWLPALLTGALWVWLLWYAKSVSACVVSHAAANLGLGLYVLWTGDWKFW